MARDDHSLHAHKWHRPGRIDILEINPHGEIIFGVDAFDALVVGKCSRAVDFVIGDEIKGKLDVSRGEGHAIRPLDVGAQFPNCLLYTSPSPRDRTRSRMPSSA